MSRRPRSSGRAPLNQFGSLLAYPTAAFKDVVAPNVNTLYTAGWFDVSKEPMIIHMPDTKDRYYVMQILDAWTNVIGSPGKRTTGTAEQDIAIVGPGWHGQLPRGIEHTFISPTSNVWIINRIQANGPHDYPAVNALQRQITATPLSSFGKPYTPPPGTVDPKIDSKTPPKKQVNAMSADEFFTALARQLMVNQPFAADSAVIRQMASIGIVPGQEFSMKTKDAATAKDIRSGARMGLEAIEKHIQTHGIDEERLAHARHVRQVRHRLSHARRCGDGRSWLQSAGRRTVPDHDGRRDRQAAHGLEPLRAALRRGEDAAGECASGR